MEIRALLKSMIEKGASDAHFKVGAFPIFRIHKVLTPQEKCGRISPEDMSSIIEEITNEKQASEFNEKNEVDYAYVIKGLGRFRVNIFRQRGEAGIIMRYIKESVPRFAELGLPPIFEKIAMTDFGIILITGSSSTGKSTTLASIIDHININKNKHVMTLENPIEYLHKDKKSVINQREIGVDTESFHMALRHIIRQDPDVIVIGEMRDRESVLTSVSAAETGHLVLSSFHAEDTTQAITRLLDFFDDSEKNQARTQLAGNLKVVTSQRLAKQTDGRGKAQRLIPAVEVLIVTPVVAKLIREDRIEDVRKVLQNGEDGMMTFNMSLAKLYKDKLITKQEALSRSSSPGALEINLKGIYLNGDKGILG